MRKLIGLAAVAAVLGLAFAPVMAGGGHDCKGCTQIEKDGQGWCDHCGHGKIYGVEVASSKLYVVLEGKEVDASKMQCKGCKEAAADNGSCDHCGVSFASGHMFKSAPAHTLAAGMAMDQAPACKGCAKTYESHGNGFCTACDAGIIANRGYKGKSTYDHALAAYAIIKQAATAAAHCEDCAVAMATDGTCEACKVSFKDGKKTS